MANGNPFYVQPGNNMIPGLQGLTQGVQQYGEQRRIDEAQERIRQGQQEMAQAAQAGDAQRLAALSAEYPELRESARQAFQITNQQTEQAARDTYMRALSDPQNAAQYMQQGIQRVSELGGSPRMMQSDLEMLQQDPEAAMQRMSMGLASVDPEAYQAVIGGQQEATPAAIRAFEAQAEAAGLEPGTEEYERAAKIELGMVPRAGASAKERIAQDPELMARVAELERTTSAAKEEGKLETKGEMLPQVRADIKKAEEAAKGQGEDILDYQRAKAAMPGLRQVVDKLVKLSDVATYTKSGQAFNTIVKELGFGATEGSTARSKMQALVDNQILPLLRDTFGAQFTEREGQRLRETMLDINAAPAEKKEILNAFIEQKTRSLETKRRKAGIDEESESDPGIGSMSLEQLQGLDRANLSDSELEAAAQRYQELTGE